MSEIIFEASVLVTIIIITIKLFMVEKDVMQLQRLLHDTAIELFNAANHIKELEKERKGRMNGGNDEKD